MSIRRAKRYRVRAAAGIVLVAGVVVSAAVAGPAQAQPVLKLPPRSAAVSWGDNQHGQLGNGSMTHSATYAGVSGLSSGVAQVSAGGDNSMALTTDGTVWTWGNETELGTGSTADSAVPVQVPGLAGITQVAAGLGFDLALRSDGTVWAWGWNASGQLGDGSTTDSDVPVQVAGLSNVIQIAAGNSSAMAVRVQIRRGGSIRTVWTWGINSSGELGDGTRTDRSTPELVSGIDVPSITAISAGGGFSLVLGSDGSVWGWGDDFDGELGDGTDHTALRPVKILDGAVTGISAGAGHALALLRGGSVLAWGGGLFGTPSFSLVPVIVPSLAGVTQISAGNDYSLAVHQVVLVFVPGGVPGTLRR
jgi:alpha-tubulin suppressor-like RCC1 family protein